MLVIPAVDVLDGRAVRLTQGDYDRVSLEGGDPRELPASLELSAYRIVEHLSEVLAADTAVTSTATTAVFAVADVYSLHQALSPRFRPGASWLANLAAIDKIRAVRAGRREV